MAPPSALIAVSQGLDEGQRCLPLPGCTSIAQGQVLVPPKRKLAVRRHRRLQREESGVETLVSPIVPSVSDHTGHSETTCPAETPALLPSQEDGAADAVKKP